MSTSTSPGQFLLPPRRNDLLCATTSIRSSSSTGALLDGASDAEASTTRQSSRLSKLFSKSLQTLSTFSNKSSIDASTNESHKRNKYYSGPDNEAEFQALQEARRANHEARRREVEQQKQVAKAQVQRYKEDRRARKRDEKVLRHRMGGLAWGYDPTAGIRPSDVESNVGDTPVPDDRLQIDKESYTRQAIVGGTAETKSSSLERGITWGIEQGGPGKEGRFEYGQVKRKQKDAQAQRDGHKYS